MNVRLWVLAVVMSALYCGSDILVVTSDPTSIPWTRLVLVTLSGAMCGPIWWAMWRAGGAMRTQIALDVIMAATGIVVVLVAREQCTARQWVCFVVILVAAAIGGK